MNNWIARKKYLGLMWEADKRLEVLNGFVNKEIHSLYLKATVESEALQIRKTLELIAYSSLIAHKDEYELIRNDISREWHATRILKKVESINPNFYPVPVYGASKHAWKLKRGGFLTKKQFITLYDRCGSILHAKNPFSTTSQRALSFHSKVPEYVSRITELLSEHTVKLAGVNRMLHVQVPVLQEEPLRATFLSTP